MFLNIMLIEIVFKLIQKNRNQTPWRRHQSIDFCLIIFFPDH